MRLLLSGGKGDPFPLVIPLAYSAYGTILNTGRPAGAGNVGNECRDEKTGRTGAEGGTEGRPVEAM